MRTTIDIDDEVLAAAKELARRRGVSAGQVVSELLKQALTAPQSSSSTVDEPAAHYGFRPFPVRGKVVSDQQIEQLREQEHI